MGFETELHEFSFMNICTISSAVGSHLTSHTASSVAKAKRDQPDDEDVNYPSNRNGDLKCLERQVPRRHGARNEDPPVRGGNDWTQAVENHSGGESRGSPISFTWGFR